MAFSVSDGSDSTGKKGEESDSTGKEGKIRLSGTRKKKRKTVSFTHRLHDRI